MGLVFGIAMVRDEADIIEATVSRMLHQVDRVIVADNGSTDGTREILDRLPVDVIDDLDPAYFQSAKMTRLAALAAEHGATWVVPFDADEVWYARSGKRIADDLAHVAPQWLAVAADLYDHVPTSQDKNLADPVRRIKYRRLSPAPLPKVACRVRPDLVIHQGNHGASYEGGCTVLPGSLVVRHFPYRTAEQFVRKARNGAAAYAATDLPDELGAHWRQYGAIAADAGDEACADIFRKWYWRDNPDQPIVIDGESQPALVFDPCK